MTLEKFPLHIFISYSSENKDLVLQIRTRLENSGIPIWIDNQKLIPGTSDWERAIRNALNSSYAVILVGTPDARDSTYVQAELAIANSLELTVFPIWVQGDKWVNSAPLSVARTQYIDLRKDNFEQGIEQLIPSLQNTITQKKPRHILVKDPYAGWYDHSETSLAYGIETYISILLDDHPSSRTPENRRRKEKMVLFNPNSYNSLQELLDDLYMGYLQDLFNPVTYGKEWILEERTGSRSSINPKRIAVPWSWLNKSNKDAIIDYEPYWGRSSLEEYGFIENSVWIVSQPDIPDRYESILREKAYGIAINDNLLLSEILYGPGKQPHPPHRAGFLEIVPMNDINFSDFKYLMVVLDIWSGRPFAGNILKESKKEFLINYPRRR